MFMIFLASSEISIFYYAVYSSVAYSLFPFPTFEATDVSLARASELLWINTMNTIHINGTNERFIIPPIIVKY